MNTQQQNAPAQQDVHIYLESNPNPNSLKFVANFMLLPDGESHDFPDADSAKNAPLAKALFDFDHVERVFYMGNFVTVTKAEQVDWIEIQQKIKDYIQEYLESGKAILDRATVKSEEESNAEETETDKKIKGILDEYVRPAVEQDGGAISYKSYEDGVVKVQLQGSCSGCPSSMVTLKSGIENLLKRIMPEVKAVEAEEV